MGSEPMDQENTSVIKLTWFDKIFKPQVITLANGHSTLRRRSRLPLILFFLALAVFCSLKATDFTLAVIVERFDKLLDLFVKLFHPKWDFFNKVIGPLADTIKMSILGTVIGCALALPVAVLSSTNIDKSRVIVSAFRFILASQIMRYVSAPSASIELSMASLLIISPSSSRWSSCIPNSCVAPYLNAS